MPWMTSRSTPAASSAGASSRARCGLTRTATVTPASRIALQRLGEQLGVHRLGVQLLQQPHGRGGSSSSAAAAHPDQRPLGVVVPGPQPLGVEHAQPAEPADRDRGRRRHHGVGRVVTSGMSNRKASICQAVETSSTLRVRRDGHDLDLVQVVAAPGQPAHADLDEVSHGSSG